MNKCPAIIASGVRTGQVCDREPINNNLTYCRYHRRQELNPMNNHRPVNIPEEKLDQKKLFKEKLDQKKLFKEKLDQKKLDHNSLDATYIDQNQVTCAICHDLIRLHKLSVILPCGHTCLCQECILFFGQTKQYKECPICRVKITIITKLFYPTLADPQANPQANPQIIPQANHPIRRNWFQRFLDKLICH